MFPKRKAASDVTCSFKTTYFVPTAPTHVSLNSGAQFRPLASCAKFQLS